MNFVQTLLLIALPFLACKAPPRHSPEGKQPLVRIGIVEQREAVHFAAAEKLNFLHQNGGSLLRRAHEGRWEIRVQGSAPARVEYRLSIGLTKSRRAAEKVMDSARDKDITAIINKLDLDSPVNLKYGHQSVYQILLDKKFRTKEDAASYQNKIRNKISCELAAIPRGTAGGVLHFTNIKTGQNFKSRGPVRIQGTKIELADVDIGSGFHWENSVTRRYDGIIEFVLDHTGKITVINYLMLENYIKGVVPSEMPTSFPFEALKAQAVTARVEALAKIGLRHPMAPYDLCDDVHCQVFSGVTKHAESTDRAVESTAGIFMVHGNELAEAFYAGVCGGHTESNANVWWMDQKPYLYGRLDKGGTSLRTRLENENNLRKWIDSRPDVFCNAFKANVPNSVGYSKRFFRWEVEYSRIELERIITEKTGETFGSLLDLKAVRRGVSGRLIELEVVGSRRSFRIGKELAIRQALSKRTLYSACFYVEKIGSQGRMPGKIILRGAGWGHGVGMCQVGAAVMAHRRKKFDQILTHYYNGVHLEKLYR